MSLKRVVAIVMCVLWIMALGAAPACAGVQALSKDGPSSAVWPSFLPLGDKAPGQPNGLYVWTRETATAEGREKLIAACTAPAHPLGVVLLNNYVSGVTPHMPPAEELHTFNSMAHQAGLKVYALYTNKYWISEVLAYNAACTDPLWRFDGYAMDYEGVEPATAAHLQYYADAKAACGDLPLHVSVGWHWDNSITYNGQTKPAYKHILDIADSMDVQTAFETAGQIVYRSRDEVQYAATLGKPVFPTIETQDVAYLGMAEWNTFYEEGEAAMWTELAKVTFAPAPFAGFMLHYYGHAYASGTALWPLPN